MWKRVLRLTGVVIAWMLGLLLVAWCFGSLWFDLPLPGVGRVLFSLAYLAGMGWLWFCGRPHMRKTAGALVMVVIGWWFTLQPSQDRAWMPELAQVAWADVQGDVVTLHNVRNSDYRTATDSTPRWETRTVRLSQLTGIDIAITYWGSPWMAHPIASFQFADSPPVCFSIETRKEVGEGYSAVRGMYRQFELIYVVADERDVIRVRTTYRPCEKVYLYRSAATPEQARDRFLEYLGMVNSLRDRPRWYHAITTNCTTSIRQQREASRRGDWDWRLLINGKGDEMLYERGHILTGGLPFEELKARSLINDAARGAGDGPEFSRRIREHLKGLVP